MTPYIRWPLIALVSPLILAAILLLCVLTLVVNVVGLFDAALSDRPFKWQSPWVRRV